MKAVFSDYDFDTTARPPVYVPQTIRIFDDGSVEHEIDGVIRAQVQAENADDYLKSPNVRRLFQGNRDFQKLVNEE